MAGWHGGFWITRARQCRHLMVVLPFATIISALPQECGVPTAGPVLDGIDLVEAHGLAGKNASLPRGVEAHAVTAFGYRFLFVTDANAAAFRLDPTAYVPRYGGYCGVAMTGNDDCCAPLQACLGPTCVHRKLRYPLASASASLCDRVAPFLSALLRLLHRPFARLRLALTRRHCFRIFQLRRLLWESHLLLFPTSQTWLGPVAISQHSLGR